MADYKHGFYWVKLEGETELTIAEYDGLWWFIGNYGGKKLDKNITILEMIERKGNHTNLETANCAIFDVSKSLKCPICHHVKVDGRCINFNCVEGRM